MNQLPKWVNRLSFSRVKIREDITTTGTVLLESDQEFIVKLAVLQHFQEVGDLPDKLLLM